MAEKEVLKQENTTKTANCYYKIHNKMVKDLKVLSYFRLVSLFFALCIPAIFYILTKNLTLTVIFSLIGFIIYGGLNG